MTGPVHFIWLGGEWLWQHWRAVERARRVQGFFSGETGTIIWNADTAFTDFGFYPQHVEVRPLVLPRWLRDHPIQLANVKDWFAYSILLDHGGMYLDLDTISLRPAWDLLPDHKGLLVSSEYHPDDTHPVRNNTAVMVGRAGADVLHALERTALEMLERGEGEWGAIGPHLVSEAALARPEEVEQAPYRALNGWSYHHIQDYYDDPRDPGEDVRVIHLYSSSYRTQFENDRWMPTA